MPIRVVCIRDRRRRGEGLRIGTVRRQPMFKPKGSMYDVWLPELAPSSELIKALRQEDVTLARFLRRYRAEMRKSKTSGRLLDMLVAMSQKSNLSVGCFCPDEEKCHRSVLRQAAGRPRRRDEGRRLICDTLRSRGWLACSRVTWRPCVDCATCDPATRRYQPPAH